jgi:hypothetical protein
MSRFLGAVLLTFLVLARVGPARAEGDKETDAVLDKAIKALGGEEKLKAVKATTWKSKGTLTFNENEGAVTTQTTVQGLDHYRQVFEGEFGGMKVMGVTVMNGDKGWRKGGDMIMELDKEALANQKRGIYLMMIPVTLLPLKGKDFKVKVAGEEKVNDKPAVGLTVTGPDGKDFKLFFDKESGLPVKLVAKVVGFGPGEFTQETSFGGYKEFDGIKKATKVESKRDGQKFLNQEITEFKVLDKVDPATFAEPK